MESLPSCRWSSLLGSGKALVAGEEVAVEEEEECQTSSTAPLSH